MTESSKRVKPDLKLVKLADALLAQLPEIWRSDWREWLSQQLTKMPVEPAFETEMNDTSVTVLLTVKNKEFAYIQLLVIYVL